MILYCYRVADNISNNTVSVVDNKSTAESNIGSSTVADDVWTEIQYGLQTNNSELPESNEIVTIDMTDRGRKYIKRETI